MTARRLPPLVGERDRFAAAVLAVERLHRHLLRRNPSWTHYTVSNGALVSVAR